tara:strand:+ start:256 stop:921 length:666 start_codon:yes stop_codon:yes gene_type:complete
MKLLTSQKNTLFDIIEESGLSPAQFDFSEMQSKTTPSFRVATYLNYKKSDFYFIFDSAPKNSASHYSIFCPGADSYKEIRNPGSWSLQLDYFQKWLFYLLREVKTENKWERLQKEIDGVNISVENNQDKFSAKEYEELKQKMTTLKEGISKYDLMPNQILLLNEKIDFLVDSAREMNKFDWKSLFIGTIISIIIQLNITPDNAKLLWNLIKQVFNNYLLPV